MPVRFGEMVLVVRTQDFASRNLGRIASNMGKLSREETLARSRGRVELQRAQQAAKLAAQESDFRNLQTVKQRLLVEQQLSRTIARRQAVEQRMAGIQARQPRVAGRFAQFTPAQLTAIRGAQAEIKALQTAEAGLLNQHNRLAQSIALMPPRLQRYAFSLSGVRDRLGQLSGSIRTSHQALNLIDDDIRQLAFAQSQLRTERLHRYGQAVTRIGRQMQLFGLISTAGFGLAAQQAAQLNTTVTQAASQARDLDAPLAQIATRSAEIDRRIKALMQDFPATADEMSASAYEIFSSVNLMTDGVTDMRKGFKLMSDANKIAVAGNVDLETATSAMITVLNNFNPALRNTSRTFDTMFDIVRFGRLRLNDFNEMMNKIAPAAKDAHQSLQDVGGAMAYLTTVMPSQRQVSTGLARLLQFFQHPDFLRGMERFNASITDSAGKLKSLDEVFEIIVKRFPELERGGQTAAEFFRTVTRAGREARTGRAGIGQVFTQEGRRVFSLIVKDMDTYRARQQQIAQNQGEFNKTYQAMLRTQGVQWKIFTNQVRTLVLVIGREAIPVFVQLGEHVRGAVRWLREHPQITEWAVKIGVFAAVSSLLGGALISVLGSIGLLLLSMRSLMKMLGGGRAGAIGRVGALATALTLLKRLSPIIIVVSLLFSKDVRKTVDDVTQQLDLRLANWADSHAPWWKKVVDPREGVKMFVGGLAALDAKMQGTSINALRLQQTLNDIAKSAGRMQDAHDRLNLPERAKSLEQLLADARTDTEKETKASLRRELQEWGKYFDDLLKQDNKGTQQLRDQAQERLNVIRQARQQAESEISQAANNLVNIYQGFVQQNQQIFGELFQGPWMTSETMDFAKQWGVVPSIRDMNKDLKGQIDQFNSFNDLLGKIAQRGGPQELLMTLRQLGPDALPMIKNLANAANPEFNRFVSLWNKKQVLIEKASRDQMNKQLAMWRSYGRNIFQQIIFGLREGDHVGLQNAFRQYIVGNFPNFIQESIDKAIADWKSQQTTTTAPKPKPPASPRQPAAAPQTQIHNNFFNFHMQNAPNEKEIVRQANWYFRQTKKTPKRPAPVAPGMQPGTPGRRSGA